MKKVHLYKNCPNCTIDRGIGMRRVQRELQAGLSVGLTSVIDGYLVIGATYWICIYHSCLLIWIDEYYSLYIRNSSILIRLVYFPIRLYSILWRYWIVNLI